NIVDHPDATAVRREHQIMIARMDGEIAHGDSREMVALELRPVLSAIDRNEESELSADEHEVLVYEIVFHDVRITADAFRILRGDQRRPGLAVIRRAKNVRRH